MLRGEGRGKPAFALFFAPVVFGGAVEWNSFIWPKNRPRKEHNLWAASRPAGGENIMARICCILVAGLDAHVHARAKKPLDFAFSSTLRPVLPAVTCTMQATLTTGATPAEHGIISNGLYTYGNSDLESLIDTGSFADFRRQVSFWEQSADLLQKPRFWNGRGWKTAMLFWQQSIPGRRAQDAADIVLTPKPEHGPDGKTISACWSRPADLYGQMVAEFGSFPLHQYWGPMASLPATAWIIQSARAVWRKHSPDIQFVYIPHLDYNLQRLGPDHAAIASDWAAAAELLKPLIQDVRQDGGKVILAGDYGMNSVSHAAFPNRALRAAGLLKTIPDAQGKLLIDYSASRAMAMVDHQVAHIYVRPEALSAAAQVLRETDGVGMVLESPEQLSAAGLAGGRCGQLVVLAKADAWLAHDWWIADAEKPAWQYSVDIHRKPGYDPRELFFDPVRKCIAQDTSLVKGSHGLLPTGPEKLPVLLSDAEVPTDAPLPATKIAEWITGLMAG